MGYNRILIPLDGSDCAELALAHLSKLANSGAKVHLVSVIVDETVSAFPELWIPDGAMKRQEREAYLEHIADGLRRQGYEVSTEVRLGVAVDNLTQVRHRGFDLVIIAIHHRTILSKFILGSVSERILREAGCPVLVI